MVLWGTLVNFLAIIGGSLCGLLFRKGLPDKLQNSLMQAIGLFLIVLGAEMALTTARPLLMLLSLVCGTAIGELMHIEELLEATSEGLSNRFGGDASWPKAFLAASMIFCIGSMSIMGALQGGLEQRHEILFTKATLDLVTSILLTASMGIGVILGALPVLIYQGAIALSASFLAQILQPEIIAEINVVGGVLLLGLGLNLVGATKLRINAMLPSLVMPFCLMSLLAFFQMT